MTAQLPSKERLQWLSNISDRCDIEDIGGDEIRNMARALLAAHEQEPVAGSRRLFTCSSCGCEGLDEPPETQCHCYLDGAHWLESKVFTHPVPFPAVPDEIDIKQAYQYMRSNSLAGCYRDGWNDRDAMLNHSGVPDEDQ